ncbi:hypothetical protein DYB28_007751 [Aphanomyces astaci]|uniref:Ubiquitin thioesterase OTU n=1 Tax=Aphanomyces astaci TaxID=112090 RepID=A0A397BYH1_APHAT|nr:hypothetical protein DYB25_008960 [Aphanomyces astaci]RHY69645.1 hypothetical protein DYB34_008492 [Aphanomyces astaci]RHY95183.1 hypothetical protein DYB31_004898 [Aphanomyces astaci]RLO11970.1 hypothetical protein DYB28_007751 [Aphanomyces astaci]
MASINLKVNSSQGSIKLSGLAPDTTLLQLKQRLLQETGLTPDNQTCMCSIRINHLTVYLFSHVAVLSGYPPKLIVGDNSELLTKLGITSGSVVTLKEEVTLASTKPSTATFVRKDKILSDPSVYNPTFLGRAVDEYCAWIMDDKSWGGEIELSILSAHFGVEMLVFDVVSMSRLCYGEDQGFTQRLFLLYDGIHYDAIAETGHRGPHSDKTLFSINDFVKVGRP